MKQSTIVIKKYENRRLYDTSSSRYINLEELAVLIRDGKDIQVVDAKTGEDLTRVVLTQIIVEDAKGKPAGLPLELLRQLIIASDYARQEFLTAYLRSAFEAYQKVQDSFQNRLADMGSAALAPFQKVTSLFSGALSPEPAKPVTSEAEVEELRRRISELEAHLKQHRTRKRRSPAKRPRPVA